MKKEQFSFLLTTIVVALVLCLYNGIGEFISVPSALLFLVIMVVLNIARNMCEQFKEWKIENHRGDSVITCYVKKLQVFVYSFSDSKIFFVSFIGFIICLLPAYIALFPGTFGYDGPVQVAQYFGKIELTTHHPLLHTYLMGVLLSLGKALFDSYTVGFAIYTALQGITLACALAYVCVIAKQYNVNILALVSSLLYTILNPFVQLIVFSSTKDALFGALLLLFVTELVSKSNTKAHIIRTTCFGALMCLFRNQGIYIVAVLLALCVIFRLSSKVLNVSLVSVLMFVCTFNIFTSNVLGIEKGDAREMLCVPMQQVTYAASEHAEELTDAELRLIEETITWDGFAEYNPATADNVKSHYNTSALKCNLAEHVANYVHLGIQYPTEYLQAWEWLIEGYWNVDTCAYSGLTIAYTFEEMNTYEIRHAQLFQPYYHKLLAATQTSNLPLYQMPEICLWVLVVLLVVVFCKKDKTAALVLLTYVLYFGTVILGPVALVRYLYPVTLATPILVSFCFKRS